jgi:predicted MFS family arabinose efflux permease
MANSIFSAGIPIGAAISNLSVIFVGAMGWRGTYCLVGVYGLLVAASIFIALKEPERSRFDVKP